MTRRRQTAIPMLLAMLVAAACAQDPKSAAGFRLPDGDLERGRAAFLTLGCASCHTVPGVDLPAPTSVAVPPVALGGEVSIVKTDGELVASILLPSHRIAPTLATELTKGGTVSPMPSNYQDVLSVRQLIDVVAFLQSRYKYSGSRSVVQ
jgi:sulfur-oxidizing protein SoxX